MLPNTIPISSLLVNYGIFGIEVMAVIKQHILFYESDKDNRREAHRIILASGAICSAPKTLEELAKVAKTEKFTMYILDLEGHQYLTSRGFCLSNEKNIILSQQELGKVYNYLADMKTFTNFIAKNRDGKLLARDMLCTITKLSNLDIFGVKKYLKWKPSSLIFQIRDSATRNEYINDVLEYCHSLELRRHTIRSVQLLCEELIMNALYDAPRDQSGNPIYKHEARTERVLLPPSQAVVMEVASDGEVLAISVTDPFGAIAHSTILEYLTRCFDSRSKMVSTTSSGGAGLGLYMCFNAVSDFIINVCPKVCSEFIGLFDISSSVKDHTKRHPSFHYFSTDNKF